MSFGVPTELVERARELAGVGQGATADRRLAVDYLLGHNRTTQKRYDGLNANERRLARAAVLRVLLEAQYLNPVVPLGPRIADRLFTVGERAAGKVVFIDPTTGIERTVAAAIPLTSG